MAYEVLKFNEFNAMGLEGKVLRAQKILDSEPWSHLEVKKLKDKEIYRAKLDDTNHLLFQLGVYKQKKYLLLLEVIRNHNYARSRFLRGHKADEFDIPQNTEVSPRLVYVNSTKKHFQILDKILSFDEAQNHIYTLALPLIVVGSAGSGKTVLMLEKMKTMLGQGLYVTHSKYLVENSRRVYYASHYENDAQEIDFFSFKEFLQTIEIPQGKEIHFHHFSSWWQRNKIGSPIKDPHKLFEEFRGVLTGFSVNCAYLSQKDYLSLGIKQSIFNENERDHVYDLFQKYLYFIEKNKFFDQNMLSFRYLSKSIPKYDFIVVDEVQDLTSVQIKLLLKHLKSPENWFLCGDSNQIVHPNFFSWSRIKSMFYEENTQCSREIVRILNNNFRNSQSITKLANSILILKNKRFGSIDKESNFLVTSMSHDEGKILRLKNRDELLKELDNKSTKSAKIAFVVPNEQVKQKAQKLFKTPLIFTIHEAKGLEYDNIVIFDFLTCYRAEFNTICSGIESVCADEALVFARAKDKAEKSLEVYKFFINSLYVAITRAIQNLIIIESQENHRFFDLLNMPQTQSKFDWSLEESAIEEWREEARRLEKQGKAEQADKIHKLILGDKQPVPWTVMDDQRFMGFSNRIFQRKITKIPKHDRRWLYHLSLLDGIFPWQKVLEKYKGKVDPQTELISIDNKYHLDYLGKNFSNLKKKIETYGIDFPNQFNRTPLQNASFLGVPSLIESLLKSGTDVTLRDLWGRTALGITIWVSLNNGQYRDQKLEKIYNLLSEFPYSFQSRQKLWRLSKRPFEYFLFHLLFAYYYNGSIGNQAEGRSYYLIDSEKLAKLISFYPDSVVPAHRKKRGYLSSILSKNEINKDGIYNRGLFVRRGRGRYILNPDISFETTEDHWVSIKKFLRVDLFTGQKIFGVDSLRDIWR